MENHPEYQYLNLIKEILENGFLEKGRNSEVLTKFGTMMKFSLKDGTLPLLTTKKVAWRVCFEELFWFISGSTNNDKLLEKNVKIWNANSSREFLDSRGLKNYKEGEGSKSN